MPDFSNRSAWQTISSVKACKEFLTSSPSPASFTVIATGFQDSDRMRRRREERHTPYISPRVENDFPEAEMDDTAPPMIMEEEVTPMGSATPAEVIPLSNVREAMVANYEQNDLDV